MTSSPDAVRRDPTTDQATVHERSRVRSLTPSLAFATVRFALGLGIVADALLRDSDAGLGFPIWIVLVCLGMAALVWRSDRCLPREAVGWLVTAAAFAAACAWRDAEMLRFFNVLACLFSLGLATLIVHDHRLSVFAARLADIATRAFRLARGTLAGIVPLMFVDLGESSGRQRWARPLWPAARVVMIVIPLALVFGSLLRGADPIFASFVSVPSIDLGSVVAHGITIGVFSWMLAGWMRSTLLEVDGTLRAAYPLPFRLGMLETTTTLVTLNVLFGAFVATQIGWFFGGERFLHARTGLTAADYARQGFFETVWVVVLVVPLLVATRAALRDDRRVARRHTALSLPIIAFVAAIIVSAVLRMRLYVHYYGLSTDRLYALVFMTWLGVVLLWLAATVLRGRVRSFAGGAAVSGLLTLGALNIASPDMIVARTNIERARTEAAGQTPLDLEYLAYLSGEAVPLATRAILDAPAPALAVATPAAPPYRCMAAVVLLQRWGRASSRRTLVDEPAAWRRWNAGERAALRTVGEHTRELLTAAHGCPPRPRTPQR